MQCVCVRNTHGQISHRKTKKIGFLGADFGIGFSSIAIDCILFPSSVDRFRGLRSQLSIVPFVVWVRCRKDLASYKGIDEKSEAEPPTPPPPQNTKSLVHPLPRRLGYWSLRIQAHSPAASPSASSFTLPVPQVPSAKRGLAAWD